MDLSSHHFVAGVAEHLFGCGIPVKGFSAGIDHDDRIECQIANRANPFVALSQRSFSRLPFGDVTRELDEARAFCLVIACP